MTSLIFKQPLRARVHVDPPRRDGSAVVQVRLFSRRGVIVINAIDEPIDDRAAAGPHGRFVQVLSVRVEWGGAAGEPSLEALRTSGFIDAMASLIEKALRKEGF